MGLDDLVHSVDYNFSGTGKSGKGSVASGAI